MTRRSIKHGGGHLRRALPVALALGAGFALRLWMLRNLFDVNGDMLIYGDLAKNLLLHGRFALTLPSGAIYSTLIRLPGYPLFLAACFKVFGMENYCAAACVQIALDLLGCLLLASFVRRIVPAPAARGAALATLWLAALCPFTASFSVALLAETPTLCMLALAMWALARFRDDLEAGRLRWVNALWFTFAITGAALLRPDGVLAAIAFVPVLFSGFRRRESGSINPSLQGGAAEKHLPGAKAHVDFDAFSARLKSCPDTSCSPRAVFPQGVETGGACKETREIPRRKLGRMAVVCALLALTPFAALTARNWRVFHVFEPLAPRMANDPGERANPGWERWVKSWCLDFISTYQIYWNVPGDKLDVSELPSRAFDSPAQYAETAALAEDYNSHGYQLTAQIDARFERLAEERIAAHPLRSFLWLPLGRVGDMWVRPRVENLNIDFDWWVYAHHHAETEFSWAYAGLNAFYLLLAIVGICLRPRFWRALLAYLLLRCALLWTVEAPETRYTLECFPMLFALGGIALSRLLNRPYLSKLKAVFGNG